jgi:hypothetical protein
VTPTAGGGKSDGSAYEETKAELARMISALVDGTGKPPSGATPLPAPARPAEDHVNGTRLSIPTPPEPDDVPEPERRPDIPEPPEPDPIPAPPAPEPGPQQPGPQQPGPQQPDDPGPFTSHSPTSPAPHHDSAPGPGGTPSVSRQSDDRPGETSSGPRQSDDSRSPGVRPSSEAGSASAPLPRRQARDAAPRRVGERSGPFAPPSVTKMADVFRDRDNDHDAREQRNGRSNGHGLAAAFGARPHTDDAQPPPEPGTRSGSTTIAGLLAEALAAYQENPDDADDTGAAPARQQPDKRDQDFDRLFDWRYQSPASGRHRSPE